MLDDYIKRLPGEKTSEGRSPLTEREKQVLRLVAEGRTSREIADALCVSPNTVQSHRNSIYEKLALHNSAELTAYAIRMGLVVADR